MNNTDSIRNGCLRALLACAGMLLLLPGPATAAAPACTHAHSGLTLPAGFCATVFADGIGHARHLTVAKNGVVYVNTWSGKYYGNTVPHAGGFLVALQDTKGTGVADKILRFGETFQDGGHGGTGIALYNGFVYAESNDRIMRYPLTAGSIVPKGNGETVVSGMPLTGDHPMHPLIIDAQGAMYVDVGTETNACQEDNRKPKSPGHSPCTELLTRGGIWRYDANRTGQVFSPAERFATGIRNGEGLAFDSTGPGLFATQHGRDQLHNNWPDLYQPEQEATLPAEELLHLQQGGDYGWPECYFDAGQDKLVLAPEYGGDGGKAVGPCAGKIGPVAAYPAHWAPDDLVIYGADQFPAHYRQGAFIAFHGSWDRAPYAQGGYNVVFQPLQNDRASGPCEVFADGFAGAGKSLGKATHRPAGLALGPDGALYVADDVTGRIYRIVYKGGAQAAGATTPCPSASAPAGPIVAQLKIPPESSKTAAVPKGATPAMVALGEQIYRGEVGGAGCTGCHGSDGEGTTLGPKLKAHQWLWSDGSYAGIQQTITQGVANPKQFRSPMPPLGGAQLSKDQVSAVAAYVWSLSHGAAAAQ